MMVPCSMFATRSARHLIQLSRASLRSQTHVWIATSHIAFILVPASCARFMMCMRSPAGCPTSSKML